MMQKTSRAVLLVGSPKGPNSTSYSLGSYLVEKLKERGITIEEIYTSRCLNSEEKRANMLRLVDESDLVILAFPLYVDSLHSQLIRALELIAEHERGKPGLNQKRVVAISNSGFPEATHNDTALTICRLFASEVGFTWAGGLAMGGGGMVHGAPLSEMGGQVRNQVKALEITADALAKGEPIPQEAIVLMSKLGFPRWMYTWMGNRSWKKEAREHNVAVKMCDQPFSRMVP